MRLIYICFLVLLPLTVSSQEETFYIQFDDQSVAEAFTKIEDTYDVLFSYKDADIGATENWNNASQAVDYAYEIELEVIDPTPSFSDIKI